MNRPTPRAAMAADEHRKALVDEAMESLDGVSDLPLEQQSLRLAEAQAVLAGVLSNDPDVVRPRLPGVGR